MAEANARTDPGKGYGPEEHGLRPPLPCAMSRSRNPFATRSVSASTLCALELAQPKRSGRQSDTRGRSRQNQARHEQPLANGRPTTAQYSTTVAVAQSDWSRYDWPPGDRSPLVGDQRRLGREPWSGFVVTRATFGFILRAIVGQEAHVLQKRSQVGRQPAVGLQDFPIRPGRATHFRQIRAMDLLEDRA